MVSGAPQGAASKAKNSATVQIMKGVRDSGLLERLHRGAARDVGSLISLHAAVNEVSANNILQLLEDINVGLDIIDLHHHVPLSALLLSVAVF